MLVSGEERRLGWFDVAVGPLGKKHLVLDVGEGGEMYSYCGLGIAAVATGKRVENWQAEGV